MRGGVPSNRNECENQKRASGKVSAEMMVEIPAQREIGEMVAVDTNGIYLQPIRMRWELMYNEGIISDARKSSNSSNGRASNGIINNALELNVRRKINFVNPVEWIVCNHRREKNHNQTSVPMNLEVDEIADVGHKSG